ncbi:MAG TPA: AI-2E family transporter [Candidatus Azoamicus sp.]
MFKLIKILVESNKELILLLLFFPTVIIIVNSSFFFPIIISIIFSYFLHNLKKILLTFGWSKNVSFFIIYFVFIAFFLLTLFILMPLVFRQLVSLFNDLPFIIQKIKFLTDKFIIKYPSIFSTEQTNLLFSNIITYVQSIGKTVISASLLSIAFTIKFIVYIFFIPIFIFFILKDHEDMINNFKKVMPQKSNFLKKIWQATNKQIGNYVRGKFIEFFIITFTSYILFKMYKLSYSDLLSVGVGLSVIIPYIGTIIISIPVVLISSVQLGLSNDFFYFIVFYSVIQFLDGNLLVPILFSEAVNLHPITIIISIIIFGSIFNLYGVVFAIPLAIVFKAIINLYLTPNEFKVDI